MTIPQPIPLSGAQLLNPPMPQSQSVNSIFQNDSLVIPGIQRKFRQALREQVMLSAAKKTLFSHLTLPSVQTFHKVLMPQLFLMMHFFTPLAFCFSLIFSSSSVKNEYSFGFRATNSVITAPQHSSFINPIFFLFPVQLAFHSTQLDALGKNHLCQTTLSHLLKYQRRNLLFQSPEQRICVCVQDRNVFPLFLHISVVEIKHQKFGEIQDCHPCEDGFIHHNPSFLHLDCNEKFIENLQIAKLGFITSFSALSASFTSSIETRFRKFSMVFPNTELFINLKNSFSNFVFPFALSSVSLSM